MKKFARHRNSAELFALAEEKGIKVERNNFDLGSDHIGVLMPDWRGKEVCVLYNVFNGRFFYVTNEADGLSFTSDEPQHDGQPWFDVLLNFFYVDAVAA